MQHFNSKIDSIHDIHILRSGFNLITILRFFPELNLTTVHFVIVNEGRNLSIVTMSPRAKHFWRHGDFMILTVGHSYYRISKFCIGIFIFAQLLSNELRIDSI